ncbi:MAG: bifunctional folylpolyglutamate synthase/dihydrofolate synthase [Nitritalea sp.]
MNFEETVSYLYGMLPMFQRQGAAAFKKDLKNTEVLCAHLGNPERRFPSIHVAGTNGKGSTSHMLAAILQSAGYRVGLYTSPHLKCFTERMRINGVQMEQDAVVAFVAEHKALLAEIQPSFFEATVAMAFWYFAKKEVDIAIIEVGMGGRLDSTNVIHPELSIITTIGLDHQQFLGNTLAAIAGEKAGIIKAGVPVVISHYQEEVAEVFLQRAQLLGAPLVFAQELIQLQATAAPGTYRMGRSKATFTFDRFELSLKGSYQLENVRGVLAAIPLLQAKGWELPEKAILQGLNQVQALTGLKGRWQELGTQPLILADTAHNVDGIRHVMQQLKGYSYKKLWMVLGFVSDKALDPIFALFPEDAEYIFTAPDIPRAYPLADLEKALAPKPWKRHFISGVNAALQFAKENAAPEDIIYVGGSTFVVAEIEEL